MATSAKRAPSFIAPERVYSLRGFQEASGVAATRMREARLQGIDCPTFSVGKRKFLKGTDAIEYLEKLASLPQRKS